MTTTLAFLYGMTTMGFVIGALFFLRFWRRTRDPLFMTFAAAFFLLALNQLLVVLPAFQSEDQSVYYVLRITAFALLIVAIVWKNVSKSPGRGS